MSTFNEFPIQLVPEVDIDTFQVTGSQVLVKPFVVDIKRTKGGIELATGESTESMKKAMIQKGLVVNIGSRVTEVQPGVVMFYYNSISKGMVRSGEDLYYLVEEYDIKAFTKPVTTN